MAAISLETPVAESLSTAVHSRIVEEGWTQEDDTALAEYIVLMLANGKTQDQVASELAGELLQDAQGTEEFARWLFEQVALLSGAESSVPAQAETTTATQNEPPQQSAPVADTSIPAAYETDMAETPPDNAPKGPRGSNSSRGGRGGRGGLPNKPTDSALHRTRGNDRINSHVRGAPRGPRNHQNGNVRPGLQKALNGMNSGGPPGPPNPMMQNGMQANPQGANMAMSPEQQMQYLAMMEQQARLMAQWNELQQGMAPGPQGRSLFDRVESGRGRGGMRGRGRGGHQNNSRNPSVATGDASGDGDFQSEGGAMDVDDAPGSRSLDPATTLCKFNTRCTNKDCIYAHQGPAAPMNIPVDTSQVCSFGVACKSTSCTGRHPSPAQIRAHQAESECKFWPNCSKPNCPFRHPAMPVCSFGASCKNQSCKFTHLQTMCRFNPCTNARCPYKHAEGQSKTFKDYTWTPESATKTEDASSKEHVSDRKFVDDAGEEELIKPDGGDAQVQAAPQVEAVDTVT